MPTRIEYLPTDRIREENVRRALIDALHHGHTTSRYVVTLETTETEAGADPDEDGRYEVIVWRDGSGKAVVARGGHSRLVNAGEPETAVRRYLGGEGTL